MDDQVVSGSDINWASSERPVVSGLCAAIGVIGGYVLGLEGLLWWVGSPPTPLRAIPGWVYHIIRVYGVVPPVVGGWVPAALAVAVGVGFGVGGWILATRDNVRHIRGMQIHTSVRKAAKTFRPFQGGLKGIPLHPSVHISNTYIDERTVDVHIRRLRKALTASGYDRYIQPRTRSWPTTSA